jgi:hypothetical protein
MLAICGSVALSYTIPGQTRPAPAAPAHQATIVAASLPEPVSDTIMRVSKTVAARKVRRGFETLPSAERAAIPAMS